MVALNLDFKQISTELANRTFPVSKQGRPAPKTERQTLTVEAARQLMQQFISEHPRGYRASGNKVLYWFLKLFDEQWINENFVVTKMAIPSVEQDRKALLKALTNGKFRPNAIGGKLKQSAAGVRASLRDEVWLQNELQKHTVRRKQHTAARRTQNVASRVVVLQAALQKILAAEDWPVRINSVSLGQKTGLSNNQVQLAIKHDRGLRHAVEAANENKVERQIKWAARQFKDEGHSVSLERILRRARVPTLLKNFDMARNARDNLSVARD